CARYGSESGNYYYFDFW
nr:immunoglobulin heavy chain junction region [Macaca mulatta]MOX93089.1 immunoglobulin heavy chain junction region [Macaca mulatta]MOX95540.1 immunoglobulin heavy chain junction region [Macaca mulatta]MOX95550.1 immunoglobulin heavy chain junction region [Macaca mulatta]MOX96684.1 immunoglobulin heavy chain junction region [Macaca mulatta]